MLAARLVLPDSADPLRAMATARALVGSTALVLVCLAFRWVVGFSVAAMAQDALVGVCVACACCSVLCDRERELLTATHDARRECRRLQEVGVALDSLLISQFDAMCVCSEHAMFIDSSPQLLEILGDPRCLERDAGLTGQHLWSWAANPQEVRRIRQFVGSVRHSRGIATTIQVSLSRKSFSQDIDSSVVEVCLYGVLMPDRGQNSIEIFLGFQVLDDAHKVLPAQTAGAISIRRQSSLCHSALICGSNCLAHRLAEVSSSESVGSSDPPPTPRRLDDLLIEESSLSTPPLRAGGAEKKPTFSRMSTSSSWRPIAEASN